MKVLTNHAGLAVILMASLLAACSSVPVDESSSTIEDTSVQTAELEMQRQAEAEAVAAAAAVEESPLIMRTLYSILSLTRQYCLMTRAQR